MTEFLAHLKIAAGPQLLIFCLFYGPFISLAARPSLVFVLFFFSFTSRTSSPTNGSRPSWGSFAPPLASLGGRDPPRDWEQPSANKQTNKQTGFSGPLLNSNFVEYFTVFFVDIESSRTYPKKKRIPCKQTRRARKWLRFENRFINWLTTRFIDLGVALGFTHRVLLMNELRALGRRW